MVRLNKITTRTGDDGSTGLVDGTRLSKSSARIEAIGAVDELNAALGVCHTLAEGPMLALLRHLQNDLFDLGADLATPLKVEAALRIIEAQVQWLDAQIQEQNAALPPLESFILPGGSALAAHLHVARTLARRAERAAVALAEAGDIGPQALAYLNRLSDLLFVLSRVVNHAAGGDPLWLPGKNR